MIMTTLWKIIQSLFSAIMKELYLHLVYLHDIDDAVNYVQCDNPIIVLFNHEGIAVIETMAPTLNSETVKC